VCHCLDFVCLRLCGCDSSVALEIRSSLYVCVCVCAVIAETEIATVIGERECDACMHGVADPTRNSDRRDRDRDRDR
jgi:hypothetical protein